MRRSTRNMAPTCCSKVVPAPPVASGLETFGGVLSSEGLDDNQFENVVLY